jgi:hypothetical protein
MIFRFLFSFIIIFPLMACSKKNTTEPTAVTIEDLLLKDNEISGWRKAGNGWIARNENELFSHIDGAAPLYTKNGFVEAAGQDYQGNILGNQTTIMLEIYDQRNSANSKAVFDEVIQQLSNAETWQDANLTDARIERFELSQNIVCWKSNYYIKLTVESNLNEALEVLKTFTANVGSKIK